MRFVWTERKGIDVVKWGLGEDCSHFGLEFSSGWVSHWTVGGYRFEKQEKFYETRKIVHAIHHKLPGAAEVYIYNKLNDKHAPKRYDWYYVMWLFWNSINRVLFKIPIPKTGTSDSKNALICHEAIELVPKEFLPKFYQSIDFNQEAINTPHRLYEVIKGVGQA